jgi:hypothetical protein
MSDRFFPITGMGMLRTWQKKSPIGVYPIGGWWKENPGHARYDRRVRYGLVVSIRATNGDVDTYTPVQVQITAKTS